MLSCKQITELVTEYVEGALPLLDRLRFQLHLGMCRHCRAYLRQMKLTVRTLGQLPEPVLTPEMERELLRRFENWRSARG